MKRLLFILMVSLLAVSACNRLYLHEEDGNELGVYIQSPGEPATRAYEGDVPGSEIENTLHSLAVWVFTSSSHELVGYLNLSEEQFPSPGRARRYSLAVTRDFARTKPDVDVFALANAASIGCGLDGNSTWEEVNDAILTNPYFGVENPVRTLDASLGLPMTGAGHSLAVQGEEPILKVETITLTRIVSKVRFAFCRMATEEGQEQENIKIKKVTLNGQLIPVSEYLFTESSEDPYHIVPNNYELLPIDTFGPETLAGNETPEKFVYAGQDPTSYETMLDKAISEGTITDWGTMYLRETNKMLTGYVVYEINGEERVKNFSMAAPGDFARNHNWTLYGYFLSGRNLQLSVRVLPWDYSKWTVVFSDYAVQASQLMVDAGTVELTETSKDHFDAHLRPGTAVKCSVYVTSPASGKLMIRATGDTYAFIVEPEMADINPDVNAGCITFYIRQNPEALGNLSGKYITLSFYVVVGDREIEADTEILNGKVYKFIL